MHGRYYVYQRPNIMLLYLMHFFQAVRHVFFHCLCDVNIYFSQIDQFESCVFNEPMQMQHTDELRQHLLHLSENPPCHSTYPAHHLIIQSLTRRQFSSYLKLVPFSIFLSLPKDDNAIEFLVLQRMAGTFRMH